MKKQPKSPTQELSQDGPPALSPSEKAARAGIAGKPNRQSTPQDDIAFIRDTEAFAKETTKGRAPKAPAGEESRRFAEVIRKMRRLQELSQEDLAEKAGLHRNFVGAMERGQMSISLDNAERLANALGVRLKDLL